MLTLQCKGKLLITKQIMSDKYNCWFIPNSNGETPLEVYQRNPNTCPFDINYFGSDYRHTLYHLLNDATDQMDVSKVRVLLSKHGADPNVSDIQRYGSQALFVSAYEARQNDSMKAIFQAFIQHGASFRDPKKAFPFGPFPDQTNTLNELVHYVESS